MFFKCDGDACSAYHRQVNFADVTNVLVVGHPSKSRLIYVVASR
jgi:hypothetical protein